MNRTKERIQNFILIITEAICIFAAYYIAGYIWLDLYKHLSDKVIMRQLNSNVLTVVMAYILLILVYNMPSNFTGRGLWAEFKSVLRKNFLFACLIAIADLVRKQKEPFPRGVYFLTIGISIVLMYFVHLIIKKILLKRSYGKGALRMIVITTKDRVERNVSLKDDQDDWMRRLESFIVVDDSLIGNVIEGVPVVADKHNMMEYIRTEVVDEVYIDMSYNNIDVLKPIVYELEDMGVTVHVRLDILDEFAGFDVTIGHIGNSVVATFAHKINAYKKLLIKRAMDIVGSLVGIVIMLIAMIFVAPAIKLDSKGPIFFKQKRVGKGGRFFYIYKFRSMYIDAEERMSELMDSNEMEGHMFKMKNDPRITKVGKFIRKTSIDELPQFINVLKGDMSLVGTRPPTLNEFKKYEGRHKRRLTMKPGITGMWQAYGRSTVFDFEEIVKMDIDYIDHWGLGLDLKILLKTVVTVFTVGGH